MSNVRVAALLFACLLAPCSPARAVFINEVLYHAPDSLDRLQFIELHNPGDKELGLAGWKLAGGVKYQFPDRAKIEAGGYLVLCLDQREFRRHYGFAAAGAFEGRLSHSRGTIELLDAGGKRVDRLRYR